MTDRDFWYGLDDKPIGGDTIEEQQRRLGPMWRNPRRIVKKETFYRRGKQYSISTMHLLLNHQYIPGSLPLIYETMIFSDNPDWDTYVWSRYPLRNIAKEGHKLCKRELLESLKKQPKPRYKYRKKRK